MIALDLQCGVEKLGDMIAAASTIVPFTGAGISTECGIPDFRSPGGLWTRNRPIPFDEFVASAVRCEAQKRIPFVFRNDVDGVAFKPLPVDSVQFLFFLSDAGRREARERDKKQSHSPTEKATDEAAGCPRR